ITKIANVIIYMIDKDVLHLNDKKLAVLLFLMEDAYLSKFDRKIFGDEYIKEKRHPHPKILGDLFDIMANDLDLDEDDERLYLITELLDYVDIEVFNKKNFIELQFVKMDEEYDNSLFEKDELQIIDEILEKYKDTTARNIANVTFQNEKVRSSSIGEVII
ncbi:MAG: DUF4065 domain-containing protein, partial [Campylobacterota bacterium]|nr:DUF4065 domain-containing protein [Campylobacterota bacterium]